MIRFIKLFSIVISAMMIVSPWFPTNDNFAVDFSQRISFNISVFLLAYVLLPREGKK